MAVDAQVSAFEEQLSRLDQQIAQLSVADIDLDDYFRNFLERCSAVLGVGGGIWYVNEHTEITAACHINLAKAGLEPDGTQAALLASALHKVIESESPVILPGKQSSNLYDGGLGAAGNNASTHTLLFVPIMETDRLAAIMLLISPEEVDPRAVRGYAHYVLGLCDRAGIFMQRHKIKTLDGALKRSDRFREYVSSLHSSLDPRRVCYALANYAQELLGVYRCTAGIFTSTGKAKIMAVSGLEAVAVKSSFIQSLAEVAKAVCQNNRPLLVDNPGAVQAKADADTDDVIVAARLYMLNADAKYMGIFPIEHDGHVVGVLVVEKGVEQAISDDEHEQIGVLTMEAASALGNSLSYSSLPLAFLMRWMGGVRDKLFRMQAARRVTVLVILAALCLAPFVIQKEVKVVGQAEIIPADARTAYAQQDGVIKWVIDLPADRFVEEGALLATLDSRAIDSEINQVDSQLNETSVSYDEAVNLYGQGSSQAQRLGIAMQVYEKQLEKLRLQREHFEIRSPVSGTVITTDEMLRGLYSRPVVRGDALIEVVPAKPEWHLLVNIPEAEAGDLLRAYDALKAGEQLESRVILNAFPDRIMDSVVASVAPRAHVEMADDRDYRNVIQVRVEKPEGFDAIQPRKGMEGKVSIHCGKRSLFYAVTNDFINYMRVSMF